MDTDETLETNRLGRYALRREQRSQTSRSTSFRPEVSLAPGPEDHLSQSRLLRRGPALRFRRADRMAAADRGGAGRDHRSQADRTAGPIKNCDRKFSGNA